MTTLPYKPSSLCKPGDNIINYMTALLLVWSLTLPAALSLTSVCMPEVSSGVSCVPLIPEGVSFQDGALSHERYSVRVLGASLPDSVPMNRYSLSLHFVLDVDDHLVAFADLNAWSWNHSVGCQNSTFNSVGQNALTVTPNGIGGIRCANLTGPAEEKTQI